MKLTHAAAVVLCGASLVIGCGDGGARVGGQVFLNGDLVKRTENIRCEVTLKPVAGGPAATGDVDESGRFRLSVGSSSSAPPGDYAASVRIREVTPPADPGGYVKSQNLSPKRFASTATSGLAYTLEAGFNEIEIEIASP